MVIPIHDLNQCKPINIEKRLFIRLYCLLLNGGKLPELYFEGYIGFLDPFLQFYGGALQSTVVHDPVLFPVSDASEKDGKPP